MSNGSRLWIMRIAIAGDRRDISLGPLATLSLAEAREKAHDIRKAVSEGRDPAKERRLERVPPKQASAIEFVDDRPTFEDCWRAFWQVKEPQLSNGKHRDQWVSTMSSYVLPHIGKRPIADVKPGEIIARHQKLSSTGPAACLNARSTKRATVRMRAMFRIWAGNTSHASMALHVALALSISCNSG